MLTADQKTKLPKLAEALQLQAGCTGGDASFDRHAGERTARHFADRRWYGGPRLPADAGDGHRAAAVKAGRRPITIKRDQDTERGSDATAFTAAILCILS